MDADSSSIYHHDGPGTVIQLRIRLPSLGSFYAFIEQRRRVSQLHAAIERQAQDLYHADIEVMKIQDELGVDLPPSYTVGSMLRNNAAVLVDFNFRDAHSPPLPPAPLSPSQEQKLASWAAFMTDGQTISPAQYHRISAPPQHASLHNSSVSSSSSANSMSALSSSSLSSHAPPAHSHAHPHSHTHMHTHTHAHSHSNPNSSPMSTMVSSPMSVGSPSSDMVPSTTSATSPNYEDLSSVSSFSEMLRSATTTGTDSLGAFTVQPPSQVYQNREFSCTATLSPQIIANVTSSLPQSSIVISSTNTFTIKPTDLPVELSIIEQEGAVLSSKEFSIRNLVMDKKKGRVIFFLKIRKNSYYGRRPFFLRLSGTGTWQHLPLVLSEPLVVLAKDKSKKRAKLSNASSKANHAAPGDNTTPSTKQHKQQHQAKTPNRNSNNKRQQQPHSHQSAEHSHDVMTTASVLHEMAGFVGMSTTSHQVSPEEIGGSHPNREKSGPCITSIAQLYAPTLSHQDDHNT